MRVTKLGVESPALPRIATTTGAGFESHLDRASPAPAPASSAAAVTGADIVRQAVQQATGSKPGGADLGSQLASMRMEQSQLLALQYELTKGTWAMLSNVLKARHDTAKNSISNLR